MSRLSDDAYLAPFLDRIREWNVRAAETERRLTAEGGGLAAFACGHEYFGLHKCEGEWVFRERAPGATAMFLVGDCSDWQEKDEFRCNQGEHGSWELRVPAGSLRHGSLFRLRVHWHGGSGDRIPSWARRVVQDENTKIFNAQVWDPPRPYSWRYPCRPAPAPVIYEAHIGMAQEREGIGTFEEFRKGILPRIADAGYNTVELMAVMEHPYYASFGYQVSSFFALSSRFGTPDEFKHLIDDAHSMGLSVLADLVHSHAVDNEVEGLSRFDGTEYQYFHEGARGRHTAWGSRCFDYGKPEVLHFLLSNCRFWLEEYRLDGFRFDGVTSMLYTHHGLNKSFESYDDYFRGDTDPDAIVYLSLANKVIHEVRPEAITIAEDVSGLPGLAAAVEDGGCGFDYRLAMGVSDCWFKLVKDVPDEEWNLDWLWHELTNRRIEEKTISYVECHDQALVGGKSLMFEMMDAEMYDSMSVTDSSVLSDRAMALHKLSRLATLTTAADGYLTFMGNEFGHPEWIDFPREGNNWSFHHARRLWRLRDDPMLKYRFLAEFDRALTRLAPSLFPPPSRRPRLLLIARDDMILAFERCGLFFMLNFHPTRSVTDYPVQMPLGSYEVVMNTDEARFGGQSRIEMPQRYFTRPHETANAVIHQLRVYLPCRTAMVLRQVD